MTRLKPRVVLSAQGVEDFFCYQGELFGPTIIALGLGIVCTIGGMKERYLKFEVYWDHYCSR